MKRNVVIMALLALVVATVVIACCPADGLQSLPSGYVWYHNDDFGCSVGHPEGWVMLMETADAVTIGDIGNKTDVAIGVDSVSSNTTLETYATESRNSAVAAGAAILSEGPIEVNNRAGYELVLTLSNEEIAVTMRAAIFVVETTAYFVVCTANEDDYNTFKDTFDTIINSTIIEEKPVG